MDSNNVIEFGIYIKPNEAILFQMFNKIA